MRRVSSRRVPLPTENVRSSPFRPPRCRSSRQLPQELKKARFIVSAEVVLTLAECAEQLAPGGYDVVLAEYPSPSWKGPRALRLFRQTVTSLLFVTTAMRSESIAQLTAHRAFDYVEREHLAQLPLAVRRALNERKLRAELEEAGRALRHSQSLYRALVENPAYEFAGAVMEEQFIDVSKLSCQCLATKRKKNYWQRTVRQRSWISVREKLLAGRFLETLQIEPLEIEWKRKKRYISKSQAKRPRRLLMSVGILSATRSSLWISRIKGRLRIIFVAKHRAILLQAWRIIAGFSVLNAEISRSQRTGREFSVVLLDLDGLKAINDRFGHAAGKPGAVRAGTDPNGLLPVGLIPLRVGRRRVRRSSARDRCRCRHISGASNPANFLRKMPKSQRFL